MHLQGKELNNQHADMDTLCQHLDQITLSNSKIVQSLSAQWDAIIHVNSEVERQSDIIQCRFEELNLTVDLSREEASATNGVFFDQISGLQSRANTDTNQVSRLERNLQNVKGNLGTHETALSEQRWLLSELLDQQATIEEHLQRCRQAEAQPNNPSVIGNILNTGRSLPHDSSGHSQAQHCTPAPPYQSGNHGPRGDSQPPVAPGTNPLGSSYMNPDRAARMAMEDPSFQQRC